jgi:leucyl-tRNA synthetase
VPHFVHQIWCDLQFAGDVIDASWPKLDASALQTDVIELMVQVNGKLRSKISMSVDADENTIRKTALADPNVERFLEGKKLAKVIIVPKRLVNVVVK